MLHVSQHVKHMKYITALFTLCWAITVYLVLWSAISVDDKSFLVAIGI